MKNRNFKIGALLVSLFAASCSPALYQSGTYNIDDMYAEHDVTRIAQEKQAIAEARKAEAEAHRAEIEARQAEAAYYASDDSYQGVLADTYESAYARRLRGFSSPTYQMPTSYFNLRYNGTYQFVSAYDPAVYNIIVMGDEVWVEPKYITSMFGTWGSPSIVSFGWSAGLYNDWYFSWGYNPYPWAYPGFGWPYYSYNPYWGYPYWGGYYPYWGYYPGWGGGHHHHPYPPHHRPNVVHRSTYRYGSGAGSNIGSATETALRSAAAASGAAGPTAIPAPASEAAHRQSIEAARPTAILRSEAAAAPTGEAVRQRTEGLTPRPPRNRTEVRAAASWAEAEGSAAETAADVTLTAVKRSPRQISTDGAQDAHAGGKRI